MKSLKKSLKILLSSFFFLLTIKSSLSAPCCGAGFAIPSIITSDDKAQLSLGFTHSKIDSDVFTNGSWRKRKEDDFTRIYRLDMAHILKDRWQIGISVPYQTRERSGAMEDSSQGPGDVSFQLGYEILPDWDYNPYRPKGISYLSLITPTGKSIYESEDGSGIDARGRGFWGIGTGLVLTKKWGKWDMNSNLEVHYSLPKKVDNDFYSGTITPSYGGQYSLGGGINYKKFRLGTIAQWTYEAPVNVSGETDSQGELKRFSSLGILLSAMFTEQDSLILNYSDQTILASPFNTSLSKSVTLFFQRRWAR